MESVLAKSVFRSRAIRQSSILCGPTTLTVTSSPQCHPRTFEQRRTIAWGGRPGGPDWQSRFESKLRRSIEKANRMLFHKCSHGMRPRSEWYRWQHGNLWGWSQFGSLGPHRGPGDGPGWSPWKWGQSSWEKEFTAEQQRFEQEFEEFKRRIHADPYGMLFGRRLMRLHPFPLGPKDDTLSALWRYLFGIENSAASSKERRHRHGDETACTANANVHSHSDGFQKASPDKEALFEFDPISGRMVPKDCPNTTVENAPFEKIAHDTFDIPMKRSRSELADNRSRCTKVEVSENSPLLDQKRDCDSSVEGPRIDRRNASSSSQGINKSGQKRSDGVFLMGAPQSQGEVNDLGSSITNTSLDNELGMDTSNSSALRVEDEKPGSRAPQIRCAQSVFDKFKDYLTCKPETYTHDRGVLANTWSAKEMALEDVPHKCRPVLHNVPYEDPERMNIDSLRANDVRASFERRNPELETQRWESKIDHIVNSQAVNALGARGNSNETTGANDDASCTATDIGDKGKVEDTTGQTQTSYESVYGEVTPKDTQAQASTRVNDSVSEMDIDLEVPITDTNTSRLTLLMRAGRTLDRIERTSSAIRASLGDTLKSSADVPTEYKILAYDSSTMKVLDAVITSTFSFDFTPLHPIEAISRLNKPSKFLAFFSSLTSQGYEIFSASGDVLVFKKTRRGDFETSQGDESGTPVSSSSGSIHSPRRATELDGESIDELEANGSTSTLQARTPLNRQESCVNPGRESMHSPQGAMRLEQESIEDFEAKRTGSSELKPSGAQGEPVASIDKQPVHSPSQAAQRERESIKEFETSTLKSTTSHPSTMVRRQETHFTGGPPNWSPYDPNEKSTLSPPQGAGTARKKEEGFLSSFRRAIRRAVLAGVVAGGTCYAIGVVAEYFRTGGQDGLGPRGFTGLEGR
uniref:Uncharacterized protein n=1 Tax=Coccidioides posadasii RMSCC 3488 TaxID=454284 RepID=A0A0J6FH41_COCPO|nr:hypothetical protein CPAG_04970 [Coccidioides posadasii RMSCC 3488]